VRRLPDGRAEAVAAARRTRPRALLRALRGDLDRIVQAALAPQTDQRYRSAGGLLEDLRRYRRGEPLTVGPASFGYRASRFVRRNRLAVSVSALLVALLVGYASTVTFQAREIRRERDRAQRIQSFALGLYGAGDPNRALGPELSAAELVAHGVARADAELAEEPDVQAEVKQYLGRVYLRLGLYEEAETLLRDVLELFRRLHGEAPPAVAEAENDLGMVLLERDDPEALTLLESALEQRRSFLGPDHLETARTLSYLAYYLRSAGRQQEAETHFREALGLWRKKDPDGVAIAGTLSGLAWTVRQLGRPREAEPLLREALEIYRRHHGELHPEVASGWHNLAGVLWQLDRWQEGDGAIRRSIEAKHGLYGEVHPDIANSLGTLAGALFRRGEHDRAAALYRQAMEMRQEVFGASHPRVAQSKAQLAEVLHASGEIDAAEGLFEEALTIFGGGVSAALPRLGESLFLAPAAAPLRI
ncbi:MAG: tetratricopeptide repeat protein, partial [Holophagales bacterium]|nr:tetratricopeptide repeat protein [Holophagales bacterium]